MGFIGREQELADLNDLYNASGSKLVVVYGRRRVGKSTLIEQFTARTPTLSFEGLEGLKTREQIHHFTEDLSKQLNDPILARTKLDNWQLIFDYLTEYFSQNKKKQVLFLDELQWLAANQKKLVSIIKKYWDKHWSKQNVMLILCGSVSSYMVKRVIQSKALYGRINWELCLQPLNLKEIYKLLGKKRSKDEVLKYAMILGGIPKYLNEVNTNQSFEQNMNKLCFTDTGILVNEYEMTFYSQFKGYTTYVTIVNLIKDKPHSLAEIADKLKMTSSGGVKSYLDNLESALFITSYVPYNKGEQSKLKKYKLTDEYLRFYFKYIAPHLKLIKTNRNRDLFMQLIKPTWEPWLGFAFENLCLKNAMNLAKIMRFSDQVISYGPLFHKGTDHFQIDLLYVRNDHVITVCEIKYLNQPVSTIVVKDVERKCRLVTIPRGYTVEKALICRFGADEALLALDYFNHIVTVEDLLE